MQAISSDLFTKIRQLESQIQELKVNRDRLNSQANEAKINASSLMIEAEEKEIQSKTLNEQIKGFEEQLKEAQGESNQKPIKELEDCKERSKSLTSQTKKYNSDLDCIIQEIYSLNEEEEDLSLIRQRSGLSES
ncbi:MAG: hypothetical protein AAGE59_31540 [Cyanobacteria bacterium P01_F01_bin.86]